MRTSWRRRDGRRGWRRRAGAIAVAGALLVAMAAPPDGDAPFLHLPGPATPPPLPAPSGAALLVTALEEEIAHFARLERSANDTQRVILRASISLRIVAAELIGQSEAAGIGGAVCAMSGLRLARGRAEIDAALLVLHRAFLGESGAYEGDPRAGLAAVSRFNDAAVDRAESLRTLDAAQLDRALPEVFGPLADALAPGLRSRAGAAWPPERASTGSGPPSSPVAAGSAHVRAAIEIAGRIDGAPWLDDAGARCRAALGAAILAHASPRRRPAARAVLGDLAVLGGVLGAAEALHQRDRAFDVKPVRRAIRAAVPAGAARIDMTRLAMLSAALDRAAALRDVGTPEVPRGLRVPLRDLRRSALEAEETLLAAIADAEDVAGAATDPAFATLVADQARRVDSVRRVARMPQWVASIAAIDAKASAGLDRRMRGLAAALLDDHRRDGAESALARFEREHARCVPLTFEQRLESADRTATAITGGLALELLAVMREARVQWAHAWSRGEEDNGASTRMMRLVLLARTMEESAGILAGELHPTILNRWAAWDTPPSLLARAVGDVGGRLKLAAAAAVRGDDAALAAQIDRMERDAPLAILVGRLTGLVGPDLARLPAAGGAGAFLAPLIAGPPPPSARMAPQRAQLALLCRYLAEAEEMREGGEADPARLDAYVRASAEELLAAIPRSSAGPGPGPAAESAPGAPRSERAGGE